MPPPASAKVNVEILDLPSITPVAMQVVLLDSLTETNESSEALSYHLTGSVDLAGYPSMPLDLWAPASGRCPLPCKPRFWPASSSRASMRMALARA